MDGNNTVTECALIMSHMSSHKTRNTRLRPMELQRLFELCGISFPRCSAAQPMTPPENL